MEKNNGGPAFPDSISLRDYFAAKAMQGIMASSKNVDILINKTESGVA